MATLLETKLSEKPAQTKNDKRALTKEQQDKLNQQKVLTTNFLLIQLCNHVSRLTSELRMNDIWEVILKLMLLLEDLWGDNVRYYFTILTSESYSEVVLQRPKDIREFAAGKVYCILASYTLLILFYRIFQWSGTAWKSQNYSAWKFLLKYYVIDVLSHVRI